MVLITVVLVSLGYLAGLAEFAFGAWFSLSNLRWFLFCSCHTKTNLCGDFVLLWLIFEM